MSPAAAATSAHVQSGIEKPPSPSPGPIRTSANEWVWPKPSHTWYVQLPSLGNFTFATYTPASPVGAAANSCVSSPFEILTTGETPTSGVTPCWRIVTWAFQVSPAPSPLSGGPRPAV